MSDSNHLRFGQESARPTDSGRSPYQDIPRPNFRKTNWVAIAAVIVVFVLPVVYLVWGFSDSGTDYFPESEYGRAALIQGDGLAEISIPIDISSNIFWRGQNKTVYLSVHSPDEWGNTRVDTDQDVTCRVTLINHGKHTYRVNGQDLTPGSSLEIHDGDVFDVSFLISRLRLKKADLELKCEFSEPLRPQTYLHAESHWSSVKY